MRSALELTRASATRGEPLDFARLAAWQAIVLGVDRVGFRTGEAFAKAGRERYGLDASTPARFAGALAEANDPVVPPQVRAARVYLDVCFYHPFPDGNARAARLALDHVLTSAGSRLHVIDPLIALSRSAVDVQGARQLAFLIGMLGGRVPT